MKTLNLAYHHQVWLVLIFGWITNYLVRSALAPVLIPLMQEFSLTYAQAGLLASAFFYAYALMQFPAGYLGDRLGKKRILIICSLGWGLLPWARRPPPPWPCSFYSDF